MKILLIGFGKINKLIFDLIKEDIVGIIDINNEQISDIPDVIIDFSHPEFLDKTISYAMQYKVPVVIGTTGYNNKKTARINQLSDFVPIMKSENFSFGIYMIKKFIAANKKHLNEYDKKIIETHHINKKDSPSGTALSLASLLDTTNIQSKRDSDIYCIHEIVLLSENEEIKITHKIINRIEFAKWVIKSTEWLINKPKGLYTFEDYLNGL